MTRWMLVEVVVEVVAGVYSMSEPSSEFEVASEDAGESCRE